MTQRTGMVDVGKPLRFGALVRSYQRLARREPLACAVILFFTLGLRASLLPRLPIPKPVIHDEFSYLLAADTYAHGRLTNPPHPFWQHFETFHVMQQPTYASKYQPLQGLVLAFGQKLFGEPWIGVFLSTGFMCAAICWMLQGWIAAEWALFGALLCVLRVGVLSYWMNSYNAGALPAIGGALAFGAVARILWKRQFKHSITWALGLSVLALSRPYDAVVVACATAAMLVWALRKFPTPLRTICRCIALPALVVLTLCAAGVAYNDYRVTGHALRLPYQVNDQQYAMVSPFAMIPLRTQPAYRHEVLRQYWVDFQVGVWKRDRAHPLLVRLVNFYVLDNFFFPFWALLIPLLIWPYDLHTAQERATVFLLLVFVLMISVLIAVQPHYAASFAGVFYLRFLQSLRRFWFWRPWGKPVGRTVGILLAVLLMGELCNNLLGLIHNGEEALAHTRGRDMITQSFAQLSSHFESARRPIIQLLAKQSGRQLVVVRYAPQHDFLFEEWVYNRADIDASKIVWAREMGPEKDRPFLAYFHHRRIWLLEPDQSPPKLSPYPRVEIGQP
jgi:hypothetical protein